jgi:ABC-type amino acid transport substrate-binding protein
MKKIIIILFALFHAQTTQAETIKIAAIDWCPQICINEESPGYTVDLIKKIFKDSEYTVDIDIFPWTRAIKYVTEGRYDALLAPAKKEAPHLIFPDFPVGYQQMCFFTDVKNTWQYQNEQSLQGMQIGIATDTSIEELNGYIQKHPEHFQFQPYHERFIAQNVRKVFKKRIDAFIFTNNTTLYELKKEKLNNKIRNAGCVSKAEIFIAFTPVPPKKTQVTKVINYFNERMAILIKSGDITKIHHKYGIKHTTHSNYNE